ncbi:hypothetical protein GCM10029964_087850 [Kibdelosporangium lantanae]
MAAAAALSCLGMEEQGWGRVMGSPPSRSWCVPGLFTYTTSKGALIAFDRGLSADVGGTGHHCQERGITVNSIAPGAVVTSGTEAAGHADLFPEIAANVQKIKRVGLGEESSAPWPSWSSTTPSHMTGQTLVVDGGVAHLRQSELTGSSAE